MRNLLNWISGGIAVLALFGIVLSILLVNDLSEFRTQFYEKGSVQYLDIDHRIESGFVVVSTEGDGVFDPVPLSELYDTTENYIDENYAKMLRGTAKVFIFTEDAFKDAKYAKVEETSEATTIPKDQVLKLLKSHELLDDFLPTTGKTINEVFGPGKTADDVRWRLFARLVFTQVENEGPLFLVHGIRNGDIVAHPRTISFRLLPLIPESFVDMLASQERIERVKENR